MVGADEKEFILLLKGHEDLLTGIRLFNLIKV